MFFVARALRPSLHADSVGTDGMPKNIAQFTGIIVTAIIVMGADTDVLYAMPLGIMAGMLATFFVAFSDAHLKVAKI